MMNLSAWFDRMSRQIDRVFHSLKTEGIQLSNNLSITASNGHIELSGPITSLRVNGRDIRNIGELQPKREAKR